MHLESYHGHTYIAKYATRGDLVAIQKICSQHKESPHDVNRRGVTALIDAVNHEGYPISQFLIRQDTDPNYSNALGRLASDSLVVASFAGRFGSDGVSVVRSMPQNADCLEIRGPTTLHKIVLEIIQIGLRTQLDNSTASINIVHAKKRASLAWAMRQDALDVVVTLLDFGAYSYRIDDRGNSRLGFL